MLDGGFLVHQKSGELPAKFIVELLKGVNMIIARNYLLIVKKRQAKNYF